MTPVVIFSVERYELPAEGNALRTARAHALLQAQDLDFVRVSGAYKGTPEVGFLVVCEGGDGGLAYEAVERIAAEYGQESVLYVDSKGYAYLHFLQDESVQPIGKLVGVPQHEALASDAYTLHDGAYYVARRA